MDTKDTISYVCENIGKANLLITTLLIGLTINILATIGKIIADFMLKRMEKSNHRANLIADRALDIQKNVFNELYDLSVYDASQSQELLAKIQEIKAKLKRDRIYFSKALFKTAFRLLDYFLVVASDYREKDIAFEDENLTLYCSQYND